MSKKKSKARRDLSPHERRYIESNACRLSVSKMAKELGRPRSTVGYWAKKVRDEGTALPAPVQKDVYATPSGGGEDIDDIDRLKRLRDMLWRMLQDADEKNAPRLAKEYRDTLADIARLEGSDEGGGTVAAIIAELA